MANASTAGATAPKTPPHGVNSEPKLNPTPLAVGSAAVSEHISTVGVKAKNVGPWIGRDVEDYRECPVDVMLQELLYRCVDHSKPLPDKGTLLDDSLQAVLPICNEEEGKVRHHVPEMVWFHKFEDTSTSNIRRALRRKDAERGRGVLLYITVFPKLDPITKLSDKKFLTAWWHIVVCHYALWNKGVYHRDISPSNLMVYRTSGGRYVGVLNDFDLSLTQDGPSGRERTGTIPFMANELLTKDAIEGKVKHRYQHDAESFIWVLTWVCLRYRNGRLLRKGRLFDEWQKVDVNGCRQEKNDFLYSRRRKIKPSRSHKRNWRVARYCLRSVALFHAHDPEIGDPEAYYSEMDDSEADDFEADDFEADDSEAEDSEADDSEADDHVSDYLADAVVFETWLQKNIPRRYRLPKLLVVPV